MIVTGSVINNVSDKRLVNANLLEGMSWKQNNILSNTSSVELPTFGDINNCFGNTSTNTAAYTVWDEYTFLLPNNVFKGSNTYLDNSFGHDFRNNTFNASCDSNRIGGLFYNNIIDNDFDNNIINDNFYDNIIDCDFQRNTIMGEFYNNHFGDADSEDFDYNAIYGVFSNNFYTGENHFEYNIIKGSFSNNIILDEFSKNTLNGFSNNVSEAAFSDSQIGEGFSGNKTYQEFRENTIGDECYDNNFFSTFIGNTLVGDEYYYNNFYSVCEKNQIGDSFRTNNIGDAENIGNTYFADNVIGNNFYDNDTLGDFQHNIIGNEFYNNTVGDKFSYNQIRNFFNNNTIAADFGFGGGQYRGNVIGNNFNANNIGEYFYDNNIGDNFTNNTVGEYFQFNRIETPLNFYDFTEFLGGVNFVSFPSTAGTDGIYPGISAESTSGNGVNAVFTVGVTGDVVNTVSISTPGKLYKINDTITINSSSFGGTTNLVLTVTILNEEPMVYGYYNKTIQRAYNETPILTAIVPGEGYYTYITEYITQPID
jgi:hypothetical protein